MRRVFKTLVLTAAVVFVGAPTQVRAEGYVSPWAGVNFSGTGGQEGKQAYGLNAGFMGAGIIGFEGSFGWAPNFFGESDLSNREIDGMGNLIIGIPIGGTSGAGIRPFVTGGLGVIHTQIETPDDDFSSNDFGFNLGAGLMGYFTDHIGVRVDVKYLRTVNSDDDIDIDFDDDFDLGGFHFWRATFGIVIR